ncbi:MAG: OmpA family protein [Myxococcaceae bacterium]
MAVLSGCPKPYPNCDSDTACAEHNEVCVQGQCQECATDANCKPGFACEGTKCVPKQSSRGAGLDAPCKSNGDCASGKCLRNKCAPVDACVTSEDCPGGQDCTEGTCSSPKSGGKGCDLEPIRFGFNDVLLTGEARGQLEGIADCMKKQGFKLSLEGHADERGTEEYNLQLSNKRAAAVKKYLADLGVQVAKLDAVGYGENRPVASGANEDAWAANRRVEFKKK